MCNFWLEFMAFMCLRYYHGFFTTFHTFDFYHQVPIKCNNVCVPVCLYGRVWICVYGYQYQTLWIDNSIKYCDSHYIIGFLGSRTLQLSELNLIIEKFQTNAILTIIYLKFFFFSLWNVSSHYFNFTQSETIVTLSHSNVTSS